MFDLTACLCIQADIFSLGIIFLEMWLAPFNTGVSALNSTRVCTSELQYSVLALTIRASWCSAHIHLVILRRHTRQSERICTLMQLRSKDVLISPTSISMSKKRQAGVHHPQYIHALIAVNIRTSARTMSSPLPQNYVGLKEAADTGEVMIGRCQAL